MDAAPHPPRRRGRLRGRWTAVAGLLLASAISFTGCGSRAGREGGGVVPPPGAPRLPIVLLPGISRETAQVMRGGTFGSFTSLALPTDEATLAHLTDPRFAEDGRTAAAFPGLLDRALRGAAVRGLQPLIDRLIREEGYVRGNPDDPRDKDYADNPPDGRSDRTRAASLFVLYYDWRRDLAESACVVADRVARIRAATGAPRVLLVGHSLGGLVVRYYLRYGGRDAVSDRSCPLGGGVGSPALNAPGADGVARAVLLGTPNRGSFQAFRALVEDFRLFGFLELGIRAAAFTMPIAWELLPSPDSAGDVPLLAGPDGTEAVALYDLHTWVSQGWLPEADHDAQGLRFAGSMLARAAAVERSLEGRQPAEDAIARLAVGSDCRPTPTRGFRAQGQLRLLSGRDADDPRFAQVAAPGDGVVTAESALGLPASPSLTTLTACARHSAYLDNPDIQARVIRFLLP